MFNIGGGELIVIVLVALIVLGPERLPGAAKEVGKAMTELRSMSRGFTDELKTALDDTKEAAAFERGDAHVAQRPAAGRPRAVEAGAAEVAETPEAPATSEAAAEGTSGSSDAPPSADPPAG